MKRKIRTGIAIILGCLIGIFLCNNQENKAVVNVSTKSSEYNNTQTQKVPVDDTVSIAETGVYKSMNTDFLKEFMFGSRKLEESSVVFENVEEMQKSNSKMLKAGNIVSTKGYYVAEDGGACCYTIQTTGKNGSIALENGLYANVIPDIYTDENGKEWLLVSVKQFGAKGDGTFWEDGKTADNTGINAAIRCAGELVNENGSSYERGLVYIPEGEYKCVDQLFANTQNLNIVGEGEKTVLFTDNDYRKENGYSEHFFQVSDATSMYFAHFRIEAREVDLYHYMRQFTFMYSDNIYIYDVDMIVPQEAYSCYSFEDKQYSNFCCYSGNKNITVDECTMVQLSGTYRGANLGILDIWSAGEENITIMNCDLYGNARDEQIGFFSTEKESAYVKNVDFINNTIHSVQLKYIDIIGNRTMCFTIGYSDSKNIEDIRVAGNHFICETDSKFMTFGAVKNCIIEDNIIEVVASYGQVGSVFDSSNGNPDNIIIQNNELFLTSLKENQGKQNVVSGRMTFKKNRFFSDAPLSFHFAYLDCKVEDNEIIFLKSITNLVSNSYLFKKNKAYLYGGLEKISSYNIADSDRTVEISENQIYDYQYYIGTRNEWKGPWCAINGISNNNVKEFSFDKNEYYCPNIKLTGKDSNTGTGEYNRFAYIRRNEATTFPSTIYFTNNIWQGVKGYISYGDISNATIVEENNTTLPFNEGEEEELTTSIDLVADGKVVEDITVFENSISLDKIVHIAKTKDEEGNVIEEQETQEKEIIWHSSVESIGTVSDTGVVTRNMYGDVKVYAVATDGSGVYGECTVHFVKEKATEVVFEKKQITMQPGRKYYTEYTVLPKEASLQQLTWTSSDETVATVTKDGIIQANEVGTAVITGTTKDGSNIAQTMEVIVESLTVKKIELSSPWLYFENTQIGQNTKLSVSNYTPSDAVNTSVGKWESINENIATVDENGNVTITGTGVGEIRAYSTDFCCYGSCTVYVQPGTINNLKVNKITNTTAELIWDADDTAYGYYIYMWNTNTAQWEAVNTTYIKENKYQLQNLNPNQEYRFSVRAYISRWDNDGNRTVYESEDSVVSFQTLTYQPVTSITCNTNSIQQPIGLKKEYQVKCNPSTANYPDLKISFQMEDSSIASVEVTKQEAGSYTISVEALKYGITKLIIKSNDAWHTTLEIPVGVVPAKMLDSEKFVLEEKEGTVGIEFAGLEDESDIDGYMIKRTTTMEYHDLQFIPANGMEIYEYEDTMVEEGITYRYSVAVCITDGTNYFTGYNMQEKYMTISVSIPSENVDLNNEKYILKNVGDEEVISAKIQPREATKTTLEWSSTNETVVKVERLIPDLIESGTDFATIVARSPGVATITAKTLDQTNLEAEATVIVLPQKITGERAIRTKGSVLINWNKVDGATGYKVYRQKKNESIQEEIADTVESVFEDVAVLYNEDVRYTVVAYVSDGEEIYEGETSESLIVAGLSEDRTDLDASQNPEVLPTENSKTPEVMVTATPDISDKNNVWIPSVTTSAAPSEHTSQPTDNKNHEISDTWVPTTNVPDNMLTEEEKGNFATSMQTAVPTTSGASEETSLKNNNLPQNTVGSLEQYNGQAYIISDVSDAGAQSEQETFSENVLAKGSIYTISGYQYVVTGQNSVKITGVTKRTKQKITIKDKVWIARKWMKVTEIDKNAFAKCKQLVKVTIGKNVTKIGKKAFWKNKKLNKIIFKGNKIRKIGKQAFEGIQKQAVFQCSKKYEEKYKMLSNEATGYEKKMKIKTKK